MASESSKTIRIKWIRSGIGFPWRQKEMVRSLGLRRLNQVVERPDTAQIRGLVARIPHLVTVVDEPAKSVWASAPEYEVHAPPPRPVEEKRTAPVTEEHVTGDAEAPPTTESMRDTAAAPTGAESSHEHQAPGKVKKAEPKQPAEAKAKAHRAAKEGKKGKKKPEKAKAAKSAKKK